MQTARPCGGMQQLQASHFTNFTHGAQPSKRHNVLPCAWRQVKASTPHRPQRHRQMERLARRKRGVYTLAAVMHMEHADAPAWGCARYAAPPYVTWPCRAHSFCAIRTTNSVLLATHIAKKSIAATAPIMCVLRAKFRSVCPCHVPLGRCNSALNHLSPSPRSQTQAVRPAAMRAAPQPTPPCP